MQACRKHWEESSFSLAMKWNIMLYSITPPPIIIADFNYTFAQMTRSQAVHSISATMTNPSSRNYGQTLQSEYSWTRRVYLTKLSVPNVNLRCHSYFGLKLPEPLFKDERAKHPKPNSVYCQLPLTEYAKKEKSAWYKVAEKHGLDTNAYDYGKTFTRCSVVMLFVLTVTTSQ